MGKDNNEGLIEAEKLAKYIINTSPRRMSNLELQKTMYFVELDYYKQTGKHLVDENFEAWQYGPVVPDVYEKYRKYGPDLIERTKENIPLDGVNIDVINKTVGRCCNTRIWDLIEESHRSDGAWQKTIDSNSRTINKKWIAEESKKYGR